jgi:hypothetical protein
VPLTDARNIINCGAEHASLAGDIKPRGGGHMKVSTLIEGIIFLVMGLIGVMEGVRVIRRIDPDSIRDVLGPGYYVIILGIILVVVGLIHIVHNWQIQGFPKVRSDDASSPRMSNPTPLYMIAVFAVYAVFIYLFGFLLASLVFFFLEFRIAGVRSLRKDLALAVGVTAVFYVIFVHYCDLVFPVGLFVRRFLA